jgi:glycine cleavage system regulatory protein
MSATLVMTVIGADRPGLVQLLATCVADHGGNWLESRLCHLGGQFAGLVRVEIPADKTTALLAALRHLETDGLRIVAQPEPAADLSATTRHSSAPSAVPATRTVGTLAQLELVGHDRPGILREISAVLAAHAVNVEELSSERVSAPMDGSMLFQARATVLIPPAVALATLRADLEKIAADLMVDVQLRPPTTARP